MPANISDSLLHECFHANYEQLVAFFVRKTGNADEARDLTHNLWLRLQRSHRPDGESAVEDAQAYLFTMARNMALDYLRRGRVADEYSSAWRLLHADDSGGSDPMLGMAQRRLLGAVDSVLVTLPERARDVFIQHRVYGAGHEELACRYGVSRSTIERDIMRAAQLVEGVLARWQGAGDAVAGQSALGAPGKRRRRLLGSFLSAAGLLIGVGVGMAWWRQRAAQWQRVFASAAGRIQRQMLPDGSWLVLDAASRVAMRYGAAYRYADVERGAAFFDVVSLPGQPFVVQAGTARITVVGTRFSVDRFRSGGADIVEVGVETGHVRVEPLAKRGDRDGPVVNLKAGDTLRIRAGSAGTDWQRFDQGEIAPWRNGHLSFRDAPLGEVIERLQRHTGKKLRITDDAARLPVTAEIKLALIDAWLRVLPGAMPVRVDWQADEVRVSASSV